MEKVELDILKRHIENSIKLGSDGTFFKIKENEYVLDKVEVKRARRIISKLYKKFNFQEEIYKSINYNSIPINKIDVSKDRAFTHN